MKKFKCPHCGTTRIWLHNWAVRHGDCKGQMIADYQRGHSLEYIEKVIYPPKQLQLFNELKPKDK